MKKSHTVILTPSTLPEVFSVFSYPLQHENCSFHVRIWNRVYAWLSDRENFLFIVLILVHLIPIWVFKYFPSQDGPIYIENSTVIREYHHPDRAAFREYYVLNKKLVPNWLCFLVLAGLMYIVPILIAEKILLSSYIILLPISIRYALCAIHHDKKCLAFMAFPFIYNYLLHMGFYNFSYSLPIFFFVLGYWLKYWEQFRLRETVTLAFLSILLYFCHLVSLVMAYVGVALLMIWFTLFDLVHYTRMQQFNSQVLWKTFRTRALPPIYVFLPTLILVVMFLYQYGGAQSRRTSVRNLLLYFLTLSSVVSYQEWELGLSTAFVGLFVAISFYLVASKVVYHRWNRWDGFLLVFFAYILIYFMTPNSMFGGSFLSMRLNLYPFFALILWFGVQSYSGIVKCRIKIVAAGIALALLGLHLMKYAEFNDYLGEYLSGMHLIEPNTTLLALSFSDKELALDGRILSRKIRPFLHASGHIAAQKSIVELTNHAASGDVFPTIFHPNLNPYIHMRNPEASPPQGDFLAYSKRTGRHIDYILVWSTYEEQRNYENTKSILRQLKEEYKLIYISPQRGLMQLYR